MIIFGQWTLVITHEYTLPLITAFLSLHTKSEAHIIPTDMTILIQAGEKGAYVKRIDGAESLVTVGTSLLNGWRLVSVTPLKYVDQKMDYIRNVILLTG
ncbi:hypothetical protein [Cohnella sp.]|uniref:hypothetical protein n=1 Tax=Cohnella sp. TaxID=1883426 RepID=UPI003569A849